MKVTTSERLQEIMRKRNLRQVDILRMCAPICDRTGVKVNRNHLSQYVNGLVEPGQDKIAVLATALNVSDAWLMGYPVPMERNPVESDSEEGEHTFTTLAHKLQRLDPEKQKKVEQVIMAMFPEDFT